MLRRILRLKYNWKKWGPSLDGLAVEKQPILAQPVLDRVRQIRGLQNQSSIMLHGIMPRSGTNYIAELLGYHPGIFSYPRNLMEFPALVTSDDISLANRRFISYFPRNRASIQEFDFHALLGAALIAYLYADAPAGKKLLLKFPGVEHLVHFYAFFPYESLIIVLRDGRDVVASTVKTWPERDFANECRRWQLSAQMIISFLQQTGSYRQNLMVVRYEDVCSDPIEFINRACESLELDRAKYPFDKIGDAPILGSSTLRDQGGVTWEPKKKSESFQPTGRWHTWSKKEKRIFKRIAGEALVALDYSHNLDW